MGGLVVRDNRDASRFEVATDSWVAILKYERRRDAFVILHTEVPQAARGRGVGALLAQTALETARAEGGAWWFVVHSCASICGSTRNGA